MSNKCVLKKLFDKPDEKYLSWKTENNTRNSLTILLELYHNVYWNYDWLSSNPNITWEIVRDNPDKFWNIYCIGGNKFLHNAIARKNAYEKDCKRWLKFREVCLEFITPGLCDDISLLIESYIEECSENCNEHDYIKEPEPKSKKRCVIL